MQAWRGVSWISGFLCALVVKKLLRASYRAVRKDTDPATAFDPTKAGFSWSDALLWGAAAGIGLVMARIVGDRLAALGWQAATHSPAPGPVEEPAAS
jgi:Protein of unknown function (DUF4235)